MVIGYARVSTNDQSTSLQLDALTKAGCETIYQEKMSGAKTDRPELQNALKSLRPGDVLIVWKLDRLGRSLKHLIETVTELEKKGVGFQSITENIDTTTPTGKLIFHIFGALAEFERGLITERVNAGIAAAKASGRVFGRPAALNAEQIAIARLMCDEGMSKTKIANHLHVARQTIYSVLKEDGQND